jgi:hypothetical protein
MGTLPIESLAFAATMLRQKRDDSINSIIGKNPLICQHLHARSALRQASCGFYAASFASSGWFLGRDGAEVKSGPCQRHRAAINATASP